MTDDRTEQDRRYRLTLETAIRFARATATVAKSPQRRAEAAARLADLETDLARVVR